MRFSRHETVEFILDCRGSNSPSTAGMIEGTITRLRQENPGKKVVVKVDFDHHEVEARGLIATIMQSIPNIVPIIWDESDELLEFISKP